LGLRPAGERGVKHVAVVGAGWSGLACALELARRGQAVAVFDAAPQAGGRARAVSLRLGDREFVLDNGQHLLIGAYSESLRLMAEVGVDVDRSLLRLPFEIRYPDGFLLRAPRLPAPLHLAAGLLGTAGLSWAARAQALAWVMRWRRSRWRLAEDVPASTLFAGAREDVVRRLWRPLCLAALNVELGDASGQVLLNVLRDSLAGDARSADLLIPRVDLTRAFVAAALERLMAGGVELRLRSPVQGLAHREGRWHIDSRHGAFTADAVVLALPPDRAAQLLVTVERDELAKTIEGLRSIAMAPIATVYLRYPATVRLPWPACALLDDAAAERHGQWVFDRGQLDDANAGVLSVVISAAQSALSADPNALATRVAAQLSAELGLPPPVASATVAEKRATVVPRPGLKRPPSRLDLPSLYLAGDAAAGDYPSTIEGSVRAGIAAALALVADAPAG
jgi:squalene-associated FAD-dependent desaturase